MTDQVKEKFRKVLALVNQGATEGEKQAAEKALQRLIDKYNINPEELGSMHKTEYRFKYSTDLDLLLLGRLVANLLEQKEAWNDAHRHTYGVKEVAIKLEYFDYVTLSASYEYFRRHMRGEWKKHCAPLVNRCRTTKTKNKKREEIKSLFFSRYVIASKLYKQEELTPIDSSKTPLNKLELMSKMRGIEGGQYNRQLNNGLLLKKIGEIHLLQLDKEKVGISIKTVEGCKLATIGEPVRDLLSDLIDCMEAMGGNATMEDFNKWQKEVKG